jgi:hypothetical protein
LQKKPLVKRRKRRLPEGWQQSVKKPDVETESGTVENRPDNSKKPKPKLPKRLSGSCTHPPDKYPLRVCPLVGYMLVP